MQLPLARRCEHRRARERLVPGLPDGVARSRTAPPPRQLDDEDGGGSVIAFAVRIVATVAVLAFVASFLFLSGWFVLAPEQPGLARHKVVDWSCPQCDVWAQAYVSRLWRPRARRRALGLLHRRLSPACPAMEGDLLILN